MSEEEVTADIFKSDISKKEAISKLEEHYIKLLESKIARLESQLEHQKPEPGSSVKDDESKAGAPMSVNNDHLDPNGEPEGESKEPEEAEPRYHMILARWDRNTGQFQEHSLPGVKDGTTFGPQKKPNKAFTFRKLTGLRASRLLSDIDDSSSSELEIIFPELQKLVGRITYKWGWSEEITKCASPYSALIYSWEEAEQEATAIKSTDSEDEKQARDDLKELLRIISTSSGDARLDRYFKDRAAMLSEGTITHNALWTLFPPGTLIVGQPCADEPQVFVVDSCDRFVDEDETFEVVCYSFDWNGSRFGRVPFQMGIEPWGGDRKSVTGLPFYPLAFHEENGKSREESIEELKNRLIKRGHDYVGFCMAEKGKQMFNYASDGEAYFHRSGAFLQRRETKLETEQTSSSSGTSDDRDTSTIGLKASWKPLEGAVIVDFASYLTYQPVKAPILGPLGRYEGLVAELSPQRRAKEMFKDMYKLDWDKPRSDPPSPEQLLCCPPRVLGYALKQKTWVQLLVRHLRSPDKADNSTFENKLQLDPDAKDLILKSVQAHAKSRKKENGVSQALDDFAPEKGRGLVIMLYGQPGVGKTLTAESVAQMTSKPLLSVGVSDIGIEGDKVEMNLQKIFALAGLWEAVLLFDEADVFLEARGEGDNDLRRNAMVSVLLRVLEYYDGILILTTNRMRSLDIAVQSRIHLAIKFTELSGDQKINIYNSFLEQLSNKGLVDNLQDLNKWVRTDGKRFDFNGRQIRNVLSTALGIALADKRKLQRDDIASVARQTDDFKRDLSTQEAIYRDRQINQRT
ncbi:hypothetical protein F5Y19DRAFT_83527 [Xylariaceae sp. FL1651]|nr:hypothetical protein F5Y19DRAFT_83527 [Xylariaceae sp. FL1651]